MTCKDNRMPWRLSQFFYILAIIILIIAIIIAVWFGAMTDEAVKAGGVHRSNIPTWVFLSAIALGILAFVQQNYEHQSAGDMLTANSNEIKM